MLDPGLGSDLSYRAGNELSRFYKIHEFAQPAGVTVKALQRSSISYFAAGFGVQKSGSASTYAFGGLLIFGLTANKMISAEASISRLSWR